MKDQIKYQLPDTLNVFIENDILITINCKDGQTDRQITKYKPVKKTEFRVFQISQ